ncbi:MAG: efflux RND transporter periplasmic adaptor subunit [Pseudomonadota bacterium]
MNPYLSYERHILWISIRAMSLGLLLLGLAVCGCKSSEGTSAESLSAHNRLPVETITLASFPVRPTARVVANVLARREVVVAAETAGRVRSLHADLGQTVKQGQILARLDATKTSHNLDLIRAQREQAQATLDIARRDLDRSEKLATQNVLAKATLDQAQNAMRLAEAQLRAVNAQVKLTGRQVADNKILAPFDAVVTERHVELGDYLTPGRPVMELVDISTVKIQAGLALEDTMHVKPKQKCEVRIKLLGPKPLVGVIAAVGVIADPRTRRVTVEVELPNEEGQIKPGMLAEVFFFLGPPAPAIFIPANAIVEQFEVSYAFVVEKNKAIRRELTLGQRRGLHKMVKKGLRAGDSLVVVGQESLAPGSPVQVVKTQPQTPPS